MTVEPVALEFNLRATLMVSASEIAGGFPPTQCKATFFQFDVKFNIPNLYFFFFSFLAFYMKGIVETATSYSFRKLYFCVLKT